MTTLYWQAELERNKGIAPESSSYVFMPRFSNNLLWDLAHITSLFCAFSHTHIHLSIYLDWSLFLLYTHATLSTTGASLQFVPSPIISNATNLKYISTVLNIFQFIPPAEALWHGWVKSSPDSAKEQYTCRAVNLHLPRCNRCNCTWNVTINTHKSTKPMSIQYDLINDALKSSNKQHFHP